MFIRYWVEFYFKEENKDKSIFTMMRLLKKGVGVTAFEKKDALNLLEKELYNAGIIEDKLPKIKNVVESFDVSTIHDRGIIVNMGICAKRRVWYPKLS